MAGAVEIRPLREDDDRAAFSCGQPALDRYFHHYAGQNQFKLHLAITYVAEVDRRIAGFVTVSAGAIDRASVPSNRVRRHLPAYPLPILRLARMAVDQRAQGLGIGKALLGHVLSLAISQGEILGCIGVVTDAKPDATRFYEKFGFTPFPNIRAGALHGEPTPMFLSLETIIASQRD